MTTFPKLVSIGKWETLLTFICVHIVLAVPMILLPATFIPQLIVLRLLKLINKDVSILDGELNQGFAEHFPLFVLLRRRLGLTVEVSPKFKAAEAKPDAQFIMGFHPHGVGSDFRVLMQGKLREVSELSERASRKTLLN